MFLAVWPQPVDRWLVAEVERLTDESIEWNGLAGPQVVVEATEEPAVERSVLVQYTCVCGRFEEFRLLTETDVRRHVLSGIVRQCLFPKCQIKIRFVFRVR